MFNRGAIANLTIAVTIALLPLYIRVENVDLHRVSKDNLFLVIILILLAILPAKRKTPKILSAFTGFIVLACVANQWNCASTAVFYQSIAVVASALFFVKYYSGFCQSTAVHVLNGMAIGAIIQATICISQRFGLNFYQKAVEVITGSNSVVDFNMVKNGTLGSLGNTNFTNAYLGICAAAFFRRKWIYYIPVIALAMFYTKSLMGIFAALGACAFYIYSRFLKLDNRLPFLFAAIAFIGAFLFGVGEHDSGRFDIWRKCLAVVDLKHFILGKGPGWFYDNARYFVLFPGAILIQEHNEFLAFFNMFGIIGAVLLAILFLKMIPKKTNAPLFGAISFAVFINCFGHFIFHQSTVAMSGLASFAVFFANKKDNDVECLDGCQPS